MTALLGIILFSMFVSAISNFAIQEVKNTNNTPQQNNNLDDRKIVKDENTPDYKIIEIVNNGRYDGGKKYYILIDKIDVSNNIILKLII